MTPCNHLRAVPKKRKPPRVAVQLDTAANTAQAADLFATMLRSVEIEEQRSAEVDANGSTSDKTIPRQ